MSGQSSATQAHPRVPLRYFALTFLLITLLIWGGVMQFASWQLRAEMDAIRGAGHPLTAEDLRAKHPEPAEPHAGTLYVQALEAMQVDENGMMPGVPFFDAGEPTPTPFRGDAWPAATLERSEQVLRDNAEALRLIEQASEMGPGWFRRWYHDPPDTYPADARLANAAPSLLRLRAGVRAQQGDAAGTYSDVVTLWKLADSNRLDADWFAFIVRLRNLASAQSATQRLVSDVALTPEQLVELARLARASDDGSMALLRALAGDRVETHEAYIAAAQGRHADLPASATVPLSLTTLLQRNHTKVLRQYADAEQYYAAGGIGSSELRLRNEDYSQLDALDSMAMLSWPERQLQGNANRHTRTDVLVVGLAVQRYFLDHGQYPAALDDLVPTYVEAIPQDAFAQAPLRYRRADTGAIVYSVGPDGVDHSGRERDTSVTRRGDGGTDITFTLGDAQRELWLADWLPADSVGPTRPAGDDADGQSH